MDFIKPTIIVSSCLLGKKCRYNGTSAYSDLIHNLRNYVNIIDVCPEEGIGLKVPRNPIRLISGKEGISLMDPLIHRDLTLLMYEFGEDFIGNLDKNHIEGIILKSKSPTCALQDAKIYESTKNGAHSKRGRGLFSDYVSKNLDFIPIEDEGRLLSLSLRESFLSKIFLLASFNVIDRNDFNGLKQFHKSNYYLLSTYSIEDTKALSILISNGEDTFIKERYATILHRLLKNDIKMINRELVYYEMYKFFKDKISIEEANYIDSLFENFSSNRITHTTILILLKDLAIRFCNPFILSQTIFSPYPQNLISLIDSGKGI